MTRHIRFLHIITLLFCTVGSLGQHKLINKVDSVLVDKYVNVKIDTNYLERPARRWTFRLSGNINFTSTELTTRYNDMDLHAKMSADYKKTISFKIGYSGISVSVSANPAKLKGKDTDWSYNCSSFGRTIGGDLLCTNTKTLKGDMTYGDTEYHLTAEQIKQFSVFATGYYVFNNRRFSYPAAFSQSYIQKRSAGSLMLGASVYYTNIKSEGVVNVGSSTQLRTFCFGVGCGYGYNWVPGKGWLIHLSAIPNVCLYNDGIYRVNCDENKLSMQFPEFILSGKAAVIYNFSNYFIGATSIIDFYTSGKRSSFHVNNRKSLSRLFWGIRF